MAWNLIFLSIKKKDFFLNLAGIFKSLHYVWVMEQFYLVIWPKESSTHRFPDYPARWLMHMGSPTDQARKEKTLQQKWKDRGHAAEEL